MLFPASEVQARRKEEGQQGEGGRGGVGGEKKKRKPDGYSFKCGGKLELSRGHDPNGKERRTD